MGWFRTSGCACAPALAQLITENAAILALANANAAALKTLISQGVHLMATEQAALDLLTKIDAATTAQAATLTTEAATLQTVSDEIDALIAKAGAGGGVSDVVLAALQTQADKAAAVSASITQQAAFSAALASKGLANPVPLPPPPATPPVA